MSNYPSLGVRQTYATWRDKWRIISFGVYLKISFSIIVILWLVFAPPAFAQSGQFETTTLESQSLVGNLWGDSSNRSARVYLPPSYRSSDKRYPVLYLLPGTGTPKQMTDAAEVLLNANELILAHSIEEMIIVEVDDRTLKYGYGMYTNSEVQGNHADYVAEDLVHHIDTTYRTVAERDSRGIAGFSVGGRGTLTLAMQRSNVFSAAYAVNSSPLCFSRPECSEQLFEDAARFSKIGEDYWDVTLAQIATEHGLVESPDQVPDDIDFSMAAAFSPNADNPPLFVDFPYELNEETRVVPEIRDKWYQHDLLHMLADYSENLASLRGLVIDLGELDLPLVPEHELFHQALVDAEVPHEFTTYPGGHLDDWSGRFQLAVQFFSETLISPEPLRACDFNVDATCDVDDVNRIVSRIKLGNSTDSLYDRDDSGEVDMNDLVHLISSDIGTWFGDANLDGEFNSGDLVDIFQVGKYETGISATWAEGDWNADSLFDSGDLVAAFQDGGFEQGPRRATTMVPESSALCLIGLAIIGPLMRRQCDYRLNARSRRPVVGPLSMFLVGLLTLFIATPILMAADTDEDGLLDLVDVIGFQTDLTEGHFRNRGIQDLDGASLLTNATSLDLIRNKITSIENDDFVGLNNLTRLELDENRISAIQNRTFAGLTSLQHLHLNGNEITSIESEDFVGLDSLYSLELYRNQITSIESGDFVGLHDLTGLELGANRISTIAKDAFDGLTSLQGLGLTDNEITSIDRGVFNGLTSLRELSLGGNPISNIEDGAFHGLINVWEFPIFGTPLTLTELNLTGATFPSLRSDFPFGRGGAPGWCCAPPQVAKIILDDALLRHDSFEAMFRSSISGKEGYQSVSIVGFRFADHYPNNLSALLELETLDEVTVDATLFEMYADEFRAFDAAAGNTVTVVPDIGDYDANGALDANDLEIQGEAIRGGLHLESFDLTYDGLVNVEDRRRWVTELKGTWLGDANLDGVFNSTDLVEVFQAEKFETEQTATWSEGDWNADGLFNSGDMVVAFQDDGFEKGQRVAVNAVPESSSPMLLAAGLLNALAARQRRTMLS